MTVDRGRKTVYWRNWVTNAISVWFMQNGVYTSSASIGTTTSDWMVKGLADVTGDGVSDIILMNNSTSEVRVWELTSSGALLASVSLGYATGMTYLGTGDFNHDGTADIAFSYSGGVFATNLAVWELRQGSVHYVLKPVYLASLPPPNAPPSVQGLNFGGIGDFNHDGYSDMAWEDASGNVQLWRSVVNHDTSTDYVAIDDRRPNIGNAGSYPISNVADENGDGTSDLIFNYNDDIYTWLIYPHPDGSTTFASVHTGQGGWSLVGASYFNY